MPRSGHALNTALYYLTLHYLKTALCHCTVQCTTCPSLCYGMQCTRSNALRTALVQMKVTLHCTNDCIAMITKDCTAMITKNYSEEHCTVECGLQSTFSAMCQEVKNTNTWLHQSRLQCVKKWLGLTHKVPCNARRIALQLLITNCIDKHFISPW